MSNYYELLNPLRENGSSISGRSPLEEFQSDRSRIIFSSSFRRLQQKAQVFSLEPNSNVRTRLTHSIEVSDIGKTLATKICKKLEDEKILNSDLSPQIIAIVENACLLHDIGNPPFGHFGESAIQKWFYANNDHIVQSVGISNKGVKAVLSDFTKFDGNPQGLRMVTQLHKERNYWGMNLTFPTLLSFIKYPSVSNSEKGEKYGYFFTEQHLIQEIYTKMAIPLEKRYPLVYIVEAADDIAYCLSDIADGIEKGIITIEQFVDDLNKTYTEMFGMSLPFDLDRKAEHFTNISVAITHKALQDATNEYVNKHDLFFNGCAKELLEETESGKILEAIKSVSRKKLYRSFEAESIELSGFSIISGLLNNFGKLLYLDKDKFEKLLTEQGPRKEDELELEFRIYNRISKKMRNSYIHQLTITNRPFNSKNALSATDLEWWLRAHLIVDHISGMTDSYALETYNMFTGIITK